MDKTEAIKIVEKEISKKYTSITKIKSYSNLFYLNTYRSINYLKYIKQISILRGIDFKKIVKPDVEIEVRPGIDKSRITETSRFWIIPWNTYSAVVDKNLLEGFIGIGPYLVDKNTKKLYGTGTNVSQLIDQVYKEQDIDEELLSKLEIVNDGTFTEDFETKENHLIENNVFNRYIKGLKNAYLNNGWMEEWTRFEKVKQGCSFENLVKLRKIYSDIPTSLIDFLRYVDGTYWRKYGDFQVTLLMLGSDIIEYPYYLLSSEEMIENENMASDLFYDYFQDYQSGVKIDEKLSILCNLKWLHFADCVNNGGTSQLFIDFSPSSKGNVGQVIRFVHDPDEFKVIANSFDEYLEKLIHDGFNFINEETI